MEIIYRSADGVLFASAEECEECVEHEQKHLLFKMWDGRGRTNSTDDAMVVWISETIGAMDKFQDYCADHDCITEGMEKYKSGLFYWDGDEYTWRHIEDRVVDSFVKFFEDKD